jgi:alpha-L-fucosidase
VHIFAWPFRTLTLEGLAGKVAYAQLLNDASEVRFGESEGAVVLDLPVKQPPAAIPVVELFLR